jgi:hypothetical protein
MVGIALTTSAKDGSMGLKSVLNAKKGATEANYSATVVKWQ